MPRKNNLTRLVADVVEDSLALVDDLIGLGLETGEQAAASVGHDLPSSTHSELQLLQAAVARLAEKVDQLAAQHAGSTSHE